jgi:hypothetical protein
MRTRAIVAVGAAALAVAAPAGANTARPSAAPVVEQMVVFRDGSAPVHRVRAGATIARIGRRRCAVAAGTALAALLRSPLPAIGLRDFGRCSRRARDGGGLFVRSIGPDRNRGQDGWVYKVGNRAATAGAADPSGPFGRGRLRSGARITWFYCRLTASGSCQRTLRTSSSAQPDGQVTVTVRAYDDDGRARPAAGATVRSGDQTAVADDQGTARLTLPQGTHQLHAEQAGRIRSFPEEVRVG